LLGSREEKQIVAGVRRAKRPRQKVNKEKSNDDKKRKREEEKQADQEEIKDTDDGEKADREGGEEERS